MAKIPQPSPPNSLPEKLQEADCERWAAEAHWTPSQAVCLLRGWKPVPEDEIPPGELHGRFLDLRRDMENVANNNDRHKVLFYYYSYGVGPKVFVPWRVIVWADSISFPVPEMLKRAFLRSHPEVCSHSEYLREIDRLQQQIATLTVQFEQTKTQTLPQYLNPMHPYFNPELEAVVLAWTALYEKRQPADARLSKDHIYTWARTRYDGSSPQRRHFGEKAMERITTLVNANKTGGRLSNKKT